MTREESSKIVEKVKIYRQSFLISDNVFKEWFRVLEPYEYKDVDEQLDEYFKDSNNFGKYPDAFYLTKYLKTTEEKAKIRTAEVRCQICGESMDYTEYNAHYDKCSSVDYVCSMSKKYLNKPLNRSKLMEMPKDKFESAYWEFCLNLYDKMEDGFQKHLLENAILTHKGQKPKYGLEEITKEMAG